MSFLVKTLMKSAVGQPPSGRGDHMSHASHTADDGHSSSSSAGKAALIRTLISRVETCVVAKDLRDTLRQLADTPGLAQDIAASQIASLLRIAKAKLGMDAEVVQMVLEIFASATDPASGRHERGDLLTELLDVSFFLGFLDDANFWVKYYAVQILQRLQEYNTSAVHRQLLQTHGLHAVIDVLNDNSNGGALRNEGLVLLTALTATDQELQTIIAFENGFESLFRIIEEEGGLESGGVVVMDCLTAMLNMLRGNNATQKFFREMGCGKHFAPMLEYVVAQSVAAADSRAGPIPSGADPEEPLSVDASIAVQRVLAILQCLVRGGDLNQDKNTVRLSLVHCGLVAPLGCVALANCRADPSIQAEALRTLVMLLDRCKPACDAFLALKVPCRRPPQSWAYTSGIWAALRLQCFGDRVMQSNALALIACLTETPGASVTAASTALKGLKPFKQPVSDDAAWQCGTIFATILFDGPTNALETKPLSLSALFYIALSLHYVLMVPQVTEQSLFVPWGGAAEGGSTFFFAYLKLVAKTVQTKNSDLTTVAALLRPIFTWLTFSGKAAGLLVAGDLQLPVAARVSFMDFLLNWSLQTRDSVHTRFICLVASCTVAHALPLVAQPGSPGKDRGSLTKQIVLVSGGAPRLTALFGDVQASSDWVDAPPSAAGANQPCIYDQAWKKILEETVHAFNASVADSSIPASPATAATPRMPSPPLPPAPLRRTSSSVDASSSAAMSPPITTVPPPLMTTVMEQPSAATMMLSPSANELQQQHQEMERELREAVQQKEIEVLQLRESLSRLTSELQNVKVQQRCADEKKDETIRNLEDQLTRLKAQHEETTLILEEALSGKDSEVQALANSLAMLETKLSMSIEESKHMSDLRSALDAAAFEREELLIMLAEMEEERELRLQTADASVISPPRTMTDVEISPSERILRP